MNSRFKFVIVTSSTCLVFFLLLGAMVGKSASPGDPYRHLSVYTEVISRIKSDYVEEPDMKSVTLGAINGLLESLDPYASYLNSDQYKQYQKNKGSAKAGVGLALSRRFGYVGVVGALPGSPAEQAGLSTGDMLESINGVATRDMPLAYAEMLLEGAPGTTLELSVLRMRRPEPQKMTLTRAPIKIPSVTAKMHSGEIGIVKVPSMEKGKAAEVANAVAELTKQGATKLVLDLRGSSFGDAAEGIAMADLFVEKGLLAYLQGQKTARENFEANVAKTIFREPLVVITNRGTANGAEVAAAALLESKRAAVVGERTYGDAAVRKAITTDDGGAVILSVAKYFSPEGKAIQDTGVTPSVAVVEQAEQRTEEDEEAPQQQEVPQQKPGEDVLLERAIDVLINGVTESAASPAEGRRDDIRMGPLNVPRR